MNQIDHKPHFPFDCFSVSLEMRILRTLASAVKLRGPEVYQAVNFDKQVGVAEFHVRIEGLKYAQHLESDGLVVPNEYGILPKGLRRLNQLEERLQDRYLQHFDALILRVIKDSPTPPNGLQVMKSVGALTNEQFKPTRSNFYPAIHRLTFAGALTSDFKVTATTINFQGTAYALPASHNRLTAKGEALLHKKEQAMSKPDKRVSPKEMRSRLKIAGMIMLPGILGSIALAYVSLTPVNSSAKLIDTRTDGVRTYLVDRGHTGKLVDYNLSPPVGGIHSDQAEPCQTNDTLIASETAVHSMEHGAVWITSRDGWKAADKKTILSAQNTYPSILGSLMPFQKSPYVLSAWGVQLSLEQLNPIKLELFLKEFSNKAPEIVACPKAK